MSKKNFNVYFDFGSSKIRAVAFNKINQKQFHTAENRCLSILKIKKLNLSNAEIIIKKIISEIEKKTNEYLDEINLMIDSPDALSISISLSKNIEGSHLKKEEVQYLIQNAKQQIIRSYPDKDIIHILVTNYKVDNVDYGFLPLNIECNKLYIDVAFICFPKKFIKNLEELFSKYDVSINQIIFSSYAKSLSYKKKLGSFGKIAFIDIGYEKTSIIYFNKENFNFLNILSIGGHHITKDIAKVLNIDLDKSEKVKLNFDKDDNYLNENNLSIDLIKKVIFARIEEILEISIKFFKLNKDSNRSDQLKLILMGEGSKILDNKFKDNISFSNDIDLLDETTSDICESGLNLIQGISKQEVVMIPKKFEKKGFFERLFHFFK